MYPCTEFDGGHAVVFWNIQKQLVDYAVENNTFLQRTVNDLVFNIHVQTWTDS